MDYIFVEVVDDCFFSVNTTISMSRKASFGLSFMAENDNDNNDDESESMPLSSSNNKLSNSS